VQILPIIRHMSLAGAWRFGSLAALYAMALLGCTPAPAPPPQHINLWSGSAIGLSSELITHLNRTVKGVQIGFKRVPGALNVVSEVERNQDMGFAQSDVAYLAYDRGIDDERFAHSNLRGIAVVWVNHVYFIVPSQSPVRDIADLRGKRIGVLVRGTSGEFVTRVILKAYGLTYADVHVTYGATVEMLERGELDAIVHSYPFLVPSIVEAARHYGLRLLSVDKRALRTLQHDYPFLRQTRLPSGLLNQPDAIETVTADSMLVCSRTLSEETVYQVTKQFFEALPSLAARFPEAALIDLEQAPTTSIPLHPGAARYYREREILR
jgi:uncharacterized protein